MTRMRRILVAAAALAAAAAVSGGLLAATAGVGAGRDFYVVAHDVRAGAPVTPDLLRVTHLQLGDAETAVVGPGQQGLLDHAVAAHDLRAGQLLERGDVASPGDATSDRRAVLLALKEIPPVVAGARIDLLALTGPAERPSVTPVAAGLEVKAVLPSGVVVLVPARQASALVYVATSLRLVAVASDPGAHGGDEPPIATADQALEALRR